MNAGQDKPQEPTSSYGETPGSLTGRLPAILSAHQQWVQTGGKEGKRADLPEAALGRASLRLVVLSEANLQGADLERAILANARLQGANLQGASLRGADLQLAALHRANLQGADLFEANLENANLPEATLQGANLYFANLRGSDLQRVLLQRALLKEAILQGANLSGANLSGANLQGADLRGADLRRANLRETNLVEANLQGADLQGADLQGGNLQGAALHHANVRDTDLTSTAGLVGAQLAGTILAGTRLPTTLSAFAALTNVTVLVKQARTLLTLLLLGCAFSWLIIAAATDAMLLTNAPAALLPHHTVPLPSATFFRFMPLLLLVLFVHFHLHLHRLWEELAELPAVFPDGRPLDRTAYPWLLLGLVRSHVWHLRALRPSPLSRLQSSLAIVMAWWLVPASLTLFWIRYLPCQDWVVTTWHVTLLVMAIGFAMLFQSLARAMLRGRVMRRFQHGAVALLCAFACHGVFSLISFGALTGIPPHLPAAQTLNQTDTTPTMHALRQLVPRLLTLMQASPFATLAAVDVSTRLAPMPEDGGGHLDKFKGANLLGRNLRYANAAGAFFVRADLRQADLSGADLRQADLRGARLEGAELRGTNLQGADLSFATGLTREQLTSTRLDATTRLPVELNVPVLSPPAVR